MEKKVAIIGAGACGLFLALLLDKHFISYDLYEKNKVGRKILASGNGKCNISNINIPDDAYHYNELALNIVKENQSKLFELFDELKIYTKTDDEGRIYPVSESSQSILNIFLKNINREVIYEECTQVKNINGAYFINNSSTPYTHVVIAIGSSASYRTDEQIPKLLKDLNISFTPFTPSLVGFKTKKLKEISGVRNKSRVALYRKNELIYQEDGEIIFKDDGVSGICVMNLSSYYANLDEKNNCYLVIDLLKGKSYDSLESVLAPKLYKYVLNNRINPSSFKLDILDTYGFEFSQVCHGGIKLEEINYNLSLKKYNNLFVGGEIIDVDGVCGGYNLMFALTSAIKIFKELK
ncbi:MAG: NAD(P)/FAD-dependent oxidoreductase [Anaeroplasma sp.]